jgi:hypothetical protein
MGDKTLIQLHPCQGGPGHFRDKLETLSDSSVNWMSYATYYDDMPWVYYVHQNI